MGHKQNTALGSRDRESDIQEKIPSGILRLPSVFLVLFMAFTFFNVILSLPKDAFAGTLMDGSIQGTDLNITSSNAVVSAIAGSAGVTGSAARVHGTMSRNAQLKAWPHFFFIFELRVASWGIQGSMFDVHRLKKFLASLKKLTADS